MASNFTLNSGSYEGRYLQVYCTQEKDIANNKSKITWTLSSLGGSVNYYSTGATTVTIAGQQVYYKGRVDWSAKTFPAAKGSVSGTIYVDHDSKGDKSVSVSLTTAIYVGATSTYSGTWQLDNIPRASTPRVSSDSCNMGEAIRIYTDTASQSFGHLVWYEFKGHNSVSAEWGTDAWSGKYGKMTNWADLTPIMDNANYIPNNRHATCTVYLNTYSDWSCTKQIGDTKSTTFELWVPENKNTKPTASMSIKLNNALIPSETRSNFDGLYIQGKSRVDVTLSGIGKYKADIKGYSTVIDKKTYKLDKFTSEVINTPGNQNIVGTVTDTRDLTDSKTNSISVIGYSKPLVIPIGSENAILCYRSDGNGKRVGSSTSVWIKAQRDYKTVTSGGVQKNFCKLQWRRKLVKEAWDDNNTDHKWKDLIPRTNTTTTEYNALLPNEVFEKTKSYTVQIMAIDDIGEKDVKTFEIPTEDVALHLGKGGKNVSIGTYCDYAENYTFYSAWKGIFKNGILGTSRNTLAEDVFEFAKNCIVGLTPFHVNKDTANLPPADQGYFVSSVGLIHKRSETQYNVSITDYSTGKIAINVYFNGTWSGWKYITPQ